MNRSNSCRSGRRRCWRFRPLMGALFGIAGPRVPSLKLTSSDKARQDGRVAAVTNVLGDAWLDVLEPQQLLVPTDIVGGEASGVTASDSKSAPLMMCYGAKTHGDNPRASKPITLT